MRAAVRGLASAVLAALIALPAHGQERLPREVFDVIAPGSRVAGGRGEMRVTQAACRVGPTHWARRRIVDIAVQEWAVFGYQTVDARPVEGGVLPGGVLPERLNPPRERPRQGRHILRMGRWENDPATHASIGGYWSVTSEGAGIIARQNRAWRATDQAIDWIEPWSAAFISWVMCEAGLGEASQFARDASHRVYIDQAIRARDGALSGTAYVAFDAGEMPVEPGDLLCNARGRASYRSLADRRPEMDRFAPTHCDVVVRVDEAAGVFHMIGGNVMNSVTLTLLPGTRDGAGTPLRPLSNEDLSGARTMFAHLKLQADPVEPEAFDNSPTIRALSGR